MEYVASLSCGKDSLAMVLRLMEENKPLTKCVMFDTGVEYKAVYNNLNKLKPLLELYGCELVVLKPDTDFYFDFLVKPVTKRDGTQQYGYSWCGGNCRWRTSSKVAKINNYLKSLGDYIQYIGIAKDEINRVKNENNKVYPLIDWEMTEKDCLEYCYSRGWNWEENGIELYQVLDRVSCWCCGNKNLKELRNIYRYLPYYWNCLKGLQYRTKRPFRRNSKETIFDLEERFKKEEHPELF